MSPRLIFSLILLLVTVFSPGSFAALEKSLAVKFYKTPKSPFASGEANRNELEKNWVQDFAEFSYLVQKEKRQFWLKATAIARDLQVSRLVFSSRTQKTYKVLQTSGSSLFVSEKETNSQPEWMSLTDLTPLPQDTGSALTLTSTQLRESPTWKSDSILSVPAGSRLLIQKFEDTWALVTFESVGQITGWVDLNNLILKHDFAAFAMMDKQNWIPILYREGSNLISSDKKRLPLSQIHGLITKPDLGISISTNEAENLLLRQNITLLKTEFQTWSQSKISGHGDVYWRKETPSATTEAHLADGISIEELMKREVVSVSFHPKNPNLALASAQGVFLTTDGRTWKKLVNFKNQDFPVLIDADSNLYVGAQRSNNLGLKFSPFFRWENLTPLLEQRQRRAVQELKIRQLTSPRPGILRMEVETNAGRVALAARTQASLIQKWDFD